MKAVEIRLKSDKSTYVPQSQVKLEWPEESNLQKLVITINMKNEDGVYWKGGIYQFTCDFPDQYPISPPKVHCNTPIYHPNIDTEGNVCLNILRKDWRPFYTIQGIIFGLLILFNDPCADDPLNHQAAAVMRDNHNLFVQNIQKSLKGGTVDGITYPKFI